MAAPFATGTVAAFLADNPNAAPADVRNALLTAATAGNLDSASLIPGTPNRMLFTRIAEPLVEAASGPAAEPAVVAAAVPAAESPAAEAAETPALTKPVPAPIVSPTAVQAPVGEAMPAPQVTSPQVPHAAPAPIPP